MDETKTSPQDEQLSYWDEHRFMLLIIGTLVIAMVMVSLSIFIYKASGSAQLDLSRPGFQSVSDKVERTDRITEYGAVGPVNKETVNEFKTIFEEQSKKAKAVGL